MRAKRGTLPSTLPRDISASQKALERKNILLIGGLVIILAIVAAMELASGASNIDAITSIQAAFGIGEPGNVATVRAIRIPRVVCAIVSGAGLALAGAALQSVLENPLASASTVGISQGAAFGATLAILIVMPALSVSANGIDMGTTALFAFAGAMVSSAIVLAFSRLGRMRPESIILVGVALSALWSGASTVIQYFANDVELTKVIFWQFGDLSRATWNQIAFMSASCVVCAIFFFANRWNYNALQNGGRAAGGLGVSVTRVRVLGVAVASFLAASMVAFVGLINFVGLIAPHIARRVVGNDYRFLLPASLVMGSIIMLTSDFIARVVISPIILPIGAITSFMGAPLFLALIYREYHR